MYVLPATSALWNFSPVSCTDSWHLYPWQKVSQSFQSSGLHLRKCNSLQGYLAAEEDANMGKKITILQIATQS